MYNTNLKVEVFKLCLVERVLNKIISFCAVTMKY